MPLTYIHCVRNLKKLLKIPEYMEHHYRDDAQLMVNISNYYHHSPLFFITQGYKLQRNVMDKYRIGYNNKYGCKNLLTIFFCDELVIILTLLAMSLLLSFLWLPYWRSSAYQFGYNTIEKNFLDISCTKNSHFQRCAVCDDYIHFEEINGTYHFGINNGLQSCNDVPSVQCPMVVRTGIDAVTYPTLYKKMYSIVDFNSFLNHTYISYKKFGGDNWGDWSGYVCDQTLQAEYAEHMAVIHWIFSLVAVLIGCGIIYIIVNKLLSYSFYYPSRIFVPERYNLLN